MKKVFFTLSLITFFSLFSFNSVNANNENFDVTVKKNEVYVQREESAVMTWPILGGIVIGDPFPFLTFAWY